MPTSELSLKRDKVKQFNFETDLLVNDDNDKATNTSPFNDKNSNLKLELLSEQDSYEDEEMEMEMEENCEFFVSELLERPKETGTNCFTIKDNQITFVGAGTEGGAGDISDGNNNNSNQDMVILFLTE